MTETYITVDVPTFDSSTITGLPDYTTIDNISYTGSNFFDVLNQIKQLLINETTGSVSNFMKVSGNQIIVGTKQFSNVTVIPNLDALGNIIDAGTLTVQSETFTQGGLNISNGAHVYDSSGNLTVNSITISPVEFSNLKYCNTLTGNVQSQLNSLNSNKEGIIFNVDGSGNLTITSSTASTTVNSFICSSINGISSTKLGYFDISSSLTTLLSNKQNTLSNASYLDFTSSGQTQLNTLTTNVSTNTTNIATNISAITTINTTLSGKQNTLSNASYLDFTSSGQTQLNTLTTNVSSNTTNIASNTSSITTINTTLSGKQNTLSNASYLDFTSSGQTQLNTLTTNVSTNTTNIATNISAITTINTTLSGKQNTLSNASYLDFTSSGQTQLNTLTTNVSSNTTNIASNTSSITTINTTLSGKQNTLSNASYLDFTSSGQTQLNTLTTNMSTNTTNIATNTSSISTINTSLSGKQSSITTSTNLSFNNLTVAGTISLPNNSISTSAINGYSAASSLLSSANTWTSAQTFAAISTTGETDSGIMTISGQTSVAQLAESFSATTGSSSPFTISYASGSVFYIPSDYSTGLSSNFNIKITNIPLQTSASRTYTLTIIYKNANKVYCNGVIIQDTSNNYLYSSAVSTYITPLYSGGYVPTISVSNVICQTFTIIYMLNSSGSLTYTQCLTSVNPFA